MQSLQQQIENSLQDAFDVHWLSLENESHLHAGPAAESHFKLTLVAGEFETLSAVKQHQAVYRALGALMQQFHALALHTFSPSQWAQNPQVAVSPQCQGGH